jgi:hypothetical protein
MIFSSFRFHLILFSLQNLLVLICFCRFWYPVPFIIQPFKHSLIFSKGFIFFLPYIVFYWGHVLWSLKNYILDKNIFGNSDKGLMEIPFFQ